MKLEQLHISIAKLSEDELRDFILENRKAQKRYRETMALSRPKKVTITPAKSKEEALQDLLKSVDPLVLQQILKDKGIV
jgi:hypothetical protein|tara:strand:+ start:1280 stop:1516 length:237 start_codon:yes stop_codon:yes gene_type:complete